MKTKLTASIGISIIVVLAGVAIGSVNISFIDIYKIVANKLFGLALPENIEPTSVAIVWSLRLPRTLLAFMAGSVLSVSGAVMQSILRNPLASSYTLGISSGASLGACIVILYGVTIPFVAPLTLPLVGFLFGLGTIYLAVAIASRLDNQMENNSIILIGMVFSLFINAITTLLSALSREELQRLIFWQMGSFSMKDWSTIFILAPVVVVGIIFITRFHRELDMMTFGEEQAKTMGVDLKRIKWTLLISSAAITGSVVAFVGVIGFVDLVAPHIVRRIVGSSHRYVLPMSALFGGTFMVICDLVARTVVSPSELPVGAVTAIIGAPFFAYIYFGKSARKA